MGEIIDKVKEKVKDVKDTIVDTTKVVTKKKTGDMADSTIRTSSISMDREYERGVDGTNINRKSDHYFGKRFMINCLILVY